MYITIIDNTQSASQTGDKGLSMFHDGGIVQLAANTFRIPLTYLLNHIPAEYQPRIYILEPIGTVYIDNAAAIDRPIANGSLNNYRFSFNAPPDGFLYTSIAPSQRFGLSWVLTYGWRSRINLLASPTAGAR